MTDPLNDTICTDNWKERTVKSNESYRASVLCDTTNDKWEDTRLCLGVFKDEVDTGLDPATLARSGGLNCRDGGGEGQYLIGENWAAYAGDDAELLKKVQEKIGGEIVAAS